MVLRDEVKLSEGRKHKCVLVCVDTIDKEKNSIMLYTPE